MVDQNPSSLNVTDNEVAGIIRVAQGALSSVLAVLCSLTRLGEVQ